MSDPFAITVTFTGPEARAVEEALRTEVDWFHRHSARAQHEMQIRQKDAESALRKVVAP